MSEIHHKGNVTRYLIKMCVSSLCVCLCTHAHSRVPLFVTPSTAAHQAPRPWKFTGKNPGVGCHSLLHGIVRAQGSNPGLVHLLHWQVDPLPLAPPGKHMCVIHIIPKLQSCQIHNPESCPIHNLVIVFFSLRSLGMSNHLCHKNLLNP